MIVSAGDLNRLRLPPNRLPAGPWPDAQAARRGRYHRLGEDGPSFNQVPMIVLAAPTRKTLQTIDLQVDSYGRFSGLRPNRHDTKNKTRDAAFFLLPFLACDTIIRVSEDDSDTRSLWSRVGREDLPARCTEENALSLPCYSGRILNCWTTKARNEGTL